MTQTYRAEFIHIEIHMNTHIKVAVINSNSSWNIGIKTFDYTEYAYTMHIPRHIQSMFPCNNDWRHKNRCSTLSFISDLFLLIFHQHFCADLAFPIWMTLSHTISFHISWCKNTHSEKIKSIKSLKISLEIVYNCIEHLLSNCSLTTSFTSIYRKMVNW